jgi:hypothetical protein
MEGESPCISRDGRLAKRIPAVQVTGEGETRFEIRDLSLGTMEVKLLDVSETGMGISGQGVLGLGQIVNISGSLHGRICKKAVVMWSRNETDGFRAGLKFIRAV